VYCLKITSEALPVTMLKFRLAPGEQLPRDEEKIFNNIGDEIIVAIHAGRDRRLISELRSAQTAMAERRTMSAYLHDQLGQNLGYLHLKLDQIGTDPTIGHEEEMFKDLQQLREIANDSYEIVRDILKKMQFETIPHLSNLLKEHASRVSRLANFALRFNSTGTPVQLLPDSQQTVFYAFHEMLSNVQKHSKASFVEVSIHWNNSCLEISVADNGVGFDPEAVGQDEHFGLEILRERIIHLRGQIWIESSPSGTVVSTSIPYEKTFALFHSN
jgi:two-component system nitrate/nitrite sensor histidine kinase NarX